MVRQCNMTLSLSQHLKTSLNLLHHFTLQNSLFVDYYFFLLFCSLRSEHWTQHTSHTRFSQFAFFHSQKEIDWRLSNSGFVIHSKKKKRRKKRAEYATFAVHNAWLCIRSVSGISFIHSSFTQSFAKVNVNAIHIQTDRISFDFIIIIIVMIVAHGRLRLKLWLRVSLSLSTVLCFAIFFEYEFRAPSNAIVCTLIQSTSKSYAPMIFSLLTYGNTNTPIQRIVMTFDR